MYPASAFQMWWIHNFPDRADRFVEIANNCTSKRLSRDTLRPKFMGTSDYIIDLVGITADEARELGVYADAQYFLDNLDRVFSDVSDRVGSRDSFSSNLFERAH
jgi:hypothetical protein